MTARDLITTSLRLIGAVAPGETVSADEAFDGLSTLNRLIDSWSTEKLLIFQITKEEFTLIAGTQSYTIGSGGDFDTERPIEIKKALVRLGSSEYPLEILSLDRWSSIMQKSVSSSIPTGIYLDGAYPLNGLSIYPKPSAAVVLVIYSLKQISQIATLDSVLSLPPGYERALIYNFAKEVSPEYGLSVNPLVFETANESKANIKRANHRSSYLRADGALTAGGSFNFITGGSN